jgi:precorrin-8X/cobalt-precorrin-8 methylmutase
MPVNSFIHNPKEIEKKSFEIITGLLKGKTINSLHESIIKRVIHTTADPEYADILKFSESAVEKSIEAIKSGCCIITDTKMVEAGIRKKTLARLKGRVKCFMDDETVAEEAAKRGITRAAISMERASADRANRIFAIGNAPTALMRLYELIGEGAVRPELVIGVPVGFVNVVESKELIKKCGIPYIISEGRKGGSTVAAAIVNALLIMAVDASLLE